MSPEPLIVSTPFVKFHVRLSPHVPLAVGSPSVQLCTNNVPMLVARAKRSVKTFFMIVVLKSPQSYYFFLIYARVFQRKNQILSKKDTFILFPRPNTPVYYT